jgi:hypothetical protein
MAVIDSMRRAGQILSLAIMLLVAASPGRAGQQCPPANFAVPKRTVALATAVATAVIRNDRSRGEITAAAGRQGVPSMMFNTGLTLSDTAIRLTPTVWRVDLGGGRSCLGVGKVEARWEIAEIVVDIAREYRPDTCQYQVVRRHEEQHVALTQAAFLAYVPKMQASLEDAVARVPTLVTDDDPKRAARHLTDDLMRALQPVFGGYERERNARNAAIDTLESYRALTAKCKAW